MEPGAVFGSSWPPGVRHVDGTVTIDQTMSGQPNAPLVIDADAGGLVTQAGRFEDIGSYPVSRRSEVLSVAERGRDR